MIEKNYFNVFRNTFFSYYFIAFLSFLLFACGNNQNLVNKGRSDYKIFVSENAQESEKFAAGELQKFLAEISGVTIPVVNSAKEGDLLIYVGFEDAPATVLDKLNPSDFENEEYIIRSSGKNLLIAGGGTRGTLYGVIGYLTDHLGCRWYTAGVSKIPALDDIPLPGRDDRQKPALEYRDTNWKEARDTSWVIHNRMNGTNIGEALGGAYITYPFVHTFYNLVSPEKYFATHPEYFAEVDGRRVGEDAQLCLTNPDVVDIATATVFDWIQAHPEANVFSVDQNDGLGYCECANCRALDEQEGSHAGSLLHFVNQIARRVAVVHPEVKLQTLAYAYTDVAPKNIRPVENVMIRLCHYDYCAVHPIEACERNRPFLEQLLAWKEIAPNRLTIWDYNTNFRYYLLPFPNFDSFTHDIKLYVDHGVKGLFMEGNANGSGEFAELRSWVMAQLMWNPEQDGWKLIDEFVNAVYGDAAPYISEYISLLHKELPPEFRLGIFAEPFQTNYLGNANMISADSLFSLAREAAGDDAGLQNRLEKAYLPLLWTKLFYAWQGGTFYIPKNELQKTTMEFKALLDKYKIPRIVVDEKLSGTIDEFLEQVLTVSEIEFYTDWQVIGPFGDEDQTGLRKVFPPEEEFDLLKAYPGQGGREVRWQSHQNNTTGYVDFNEIFGYSEFALAYAHRIISLPEAQTVKFGVGNNDGIRIWINGKLVFEQAEAAIGPNRNTFTAALNEGENTILVKLDQLRHGWGFYFTRLD